jgi:redox-sensitive bicupin YhaK (pirin superfamily)
MTIDVRKSGERGYFDYGWLKTYHTFSFGQYDHPSYRGFRTLRVLNEDTISPGVGFPLHSHQDMEIFSIVIEGGLSHQDDIGNGSILREGQIQLMSAGRGVTHSEFNASDKEETHFLQIWILPDARKLRPSYQEKFFPPSSRHNQLCLIISSDGREGSLHIHQDANIYLSNLEKSKELNYELGIKRYGWVQLIKGEIDLNGTRLDHGDGAAISETSSLHFKAKENSEFVFIDLV